MLRLGPRRRVIEQVDDVVRKLTAVECRKTHGRLAAEKRLHAVQRRAHDRQAKRGVLDELGDESAVRAARRLVRDDADACLAKPPGVYGDAIDLLITPPDFQGEVRYTLDGSVPGPEAKRFTVPLRLAKPRGRTEKKASSR